MVSRIKQLLEWQQLSPTQFADRIGVGRPVVSHILSERNKPSLEVARSIKAAFPELSLDWLLNGSGEMLASAPFVSPQILPAAVAPIASASLGAPQATVVPPTTPAATLPDTTRQVSEKQAYPAPTAGLATPGRFTATGAAAPVPPSAARVAARRFVAAGARAILSQEPPLPATAASPAPAPNTPPDSEVENLTDSGGVLAASPATPAVSYAPAVPAPAAPAPAGVAGLAQALAGEPGQPGKAIRRIVIFYSDGSFADYKPENQA